MQIEPDILADAAKLITLCKAKGEMIATAESCTGGLIAGGLTAVDGSSSVVDCGFVTYSNEAKHGLIGVAQELLDKHGAVSEPVAIAMAKGALARAPLATMAIAVTGIAGPGGGSEEKPVGLVHLACAGNDRPALHRRRVYDGDRHAVRKATILEAYDMLSEMAGKSK